MRQAQPIWMIIKFREVGNIRLNKESKTHDNAITTSHIQGSPREMASIKFKRSMKLLLRDMTGLKGTPGPKRGLTTWVPNAKSELNRTSMYRKALPFT